MKRKKKATALPNFPKNRNQKESQKQKLELADLKFKKIKDKKNANKEIGKGRNLVMIIEMG